MEPKQSCRFEPILQVLVLPHQRCAQSQLVEVRSSIEQRAEGCVISAYRWPEKVFRSLLEEVREG
ncbi:hypothetical protein ACFWNH_30605 [Rhodococcus qingshengii]|uniref:hypothetical protein n=1 Tax=Rhodococcus qingshengii TaxID=334542 RepID=UPI0036673941